MERQSSLMTKDLHPLFTGYRQGHVDTYLVRKLVALEFSGPIVKDSDIFSSGKLKKAKILAILNP